MKKKDDEFEKKRKKQRIKRFLILFILIAIVILDVEITANGGGLKGVVSLFWNKSSEKLENLDTMYVLIMGVSSDLKKELTDTIMLCAYNPKQQQAAMLSIPRDTFIGDNTKQAKGTDKINTLYSKNPQKILEVVSNITGIKVENYAVINTKALVEIVDLIGGVEFNVPMNMDYDDETQNLHIHLKKGMQRLNGNQAEQLLRYRHSNPDKNGSMTTYSSEYGRDDFGRMRTQRDFLFATATQTLQFKNLFKLSKILKAGFDNIETNLKMEMISPYVPYAIDFNISDFESLQLPGKSTKYNGLWFFEYNKEETTKMVGEMKNKLEGIE